MQILSWASRANEKQGNMMDTTGLKFKVINLIALFSNPTWDKNGIDVLFMINIRQVAMKEIVLKTSTFISIKSIYKYEISYL